MDRFIRDRECRAITGLSYVTRWRREREGAFPCRYRISSGAVAWKLSEVEKWIEERNVAREQNP